MCAQRWSQGFVSGFGPSNNQDLRWGCGGNSGTPPALETNLDFEGVKRPISQEFKRPMHTLRSHALRIAVCERCRRRWAASARPLAAVPALAAHWFASAASEEILWCRRLISRADLELDFTTLNGTTTAPLGPKYSRLLHRLWDPGQAMFVSLTQGRLHLCSRRNPVVAVTTGALHSTRSHHPSGIQSS